MPDEITDIPDGIAAKPDENAMKLSGWFAIPDADAMNEDKLARMGNEIAVILNRFAVKRLAQHPQCFESE